MKVRGYSFLEDTGANYGNAAELLESAGNKCALHCLQKAVGFHMEAGRLHTAARILRDMTKMQEKEGLKEECLEFYERYAPILTVTWMLSE
ncbi:hypothetical protein ABBQ32_007866 [Trebouxia sp. C0010 RCD-2024]